MKTIFTGFLTAICSLSLFAEPVSSGEALNKAKANLTSAQQEFVQLQQTIAQEESPLVVAIQSLEEEIRFREKSLRELKAKELQIAGKEKRLDNELASRRGEFDYTKNVLDGYAKGFLNRVQSAEVQLYQEHWICQITCS